MKKFTGICFALVLSNGVVADNMEAIVKGVQAVCQSPSQAGKYWNVTAAGEATANGSVRLVTAGIAGEVTFTKGEWDGVQQVLKAQQAVDNKSFRECSIALTPLFLAKFSSATPAAKSSNTNNMIENSAITNSIVNQAGGDINK